MQGNAPYIPSTPQENREAQNFIAALSEVSASHVTNGVRSLLGCDDPAATEEAAGMFLQTVSIPAARLSDADWQRVRAAALAECGKPACNCRTLRANFFIALDAVRTKQKEVNEMQRPPSQPSPTVPASGRKLHG